MNDVHYPSISELAKAEIIEPLDVHFSNTVEHLSKCYDTAVLLGAAMVSRAVAQGHVCLALEDLAGKPVVGVDGEALPNRSWPSLTNWADQLRRSELVSPVDRASETLASRPEASGPSDSSTPEGTELVSAHVSAHDSTATPLVLDAAHRLYLNRYYRYERRLAQSINQRAERIDERVDRALLRSGIERLFPASDQGPSGFDLQRLAALIAVERGFCVISGGPGTGKTSTVVKILALLQEQALASGASPLKVALVAPTGKAAARLVESIENQKAALDVEPAVIDSIPTDAATIHRKLGYRPNSPTRFRHDASNPLRADVVVVDEASMVDLALMAKLVDAVRPNAKLILLGDRDQLASVEAGAVLGDICNTSGARPGYSRVFSSRVEATLGEQLPVEGSEPGAEAEVPGISDAIVHLTHSWRFDDESGIGRLAKAINDGDGDATDSLLISVPSGGIGARPNGADDRSVVLVEAVDSQAVDAEISRLAVARYRNYLNAQTPDEALERLDAFRVLCAHRVGPYGVEHINDVIERALAEAGLLELGGTFYLRRPVMVTRNDYQLQLFNGDVGVIFADRMAGSSQSSRRLAYFPSSSGERLRELPSSRLPPHRTVFAMTVHKSQGSEFDRIALVLPDGVSRVLTRELLYTGVTRARSQVTILGSRDVIREAVKKRVDRSSGLRDALWNS